ncbi:hypothetical protein [Candidatus Entotheonella palauensis]|uniref:hypothetical protein n=1 Tax=Candidatus Entotheonella palauensis TaxID=93172 RepID=UPI000B7D306F|nr:hypothetical protein [Candidatus Entotheonella palauensis]
MEIKEATQLIESFVKGLSKAQRAVKWQPALVVGGYGFQAVFPNFSITIAQYKRRNGDFIYQLLIYDEDVNLVGAVASDDSDDQAMLRDIFQQAEKQLVGQVEEVQPESYNPDIYEDWNQALQKSLPLETNGVWYAPVLPRRGERPFWGRREGGRYAQTPLRAGNVVWERHNGTVAVVDDTGVRISGERIYLNPLLDGRIDVKAAGQPDTVTMSPDELNVDLHVLPAAITNGMRNFVTPSGLRGWVQRLLKTGSARDHTRVAGGP